MPGTTPTIAPCECTNDYTGARSSLYRESAYRILIYTHTSDSHRHELRESLSRKRYKQASAAS